MKLNQIYAEDRPIASVAKLLGETGLRLFPAKEGGEFAKAPYTTNGVDSATDDVNWIGESWSKWPKAAVAVPTGSENGFVAIDLDVKNDKNGIKTIEDLGVDLTDTWAATTPSNGLHLYYRAPTDFVVQNDVERRLGPGVDVRGERGYVLWPPSEIADGQYNFVLGQEPWAISIADLPEVLVDKLKSPKTNRRQLKGFRQPAKLNLDFLLSPVVEGSRDVELTRRCGYLINFYGPRSEVLDLLKDINRKCCLPPLPERQVEKIFNSIRKREVRND